MHMLNFLDTFSMGITVTCTDLETTVSTTGSGIAFCGECWFSGWVGVGVEMVVYLGDG